MWFDFSFGLGALVIVVILAAASIKILREYERAVVFLLGRFQASAPWCSCSAASRR